MRTISIIIYCLVTVAAALLPMTQGSRRPRFMKFYRRMAEKAWARKAFTLGLAVMALAWNFACFISYGTSPWLLPGMVLSFSLLSYRLTHAALWRLAEIRSVLYASFCLLLAVLCVHMALGFPPELISLYMSVALILEAGCLYPTRQVIWTAEDWLAGQRYEPDDGELYQLYFRQRKE